MSLSRILAVTGLALLSACYFEDRTPAGSRRDEAQIREVVVEFYRGLAAGDWGLVSNFFTPDGRVSFLGIPQGDSTPQAEILPADSALLQWARQAGENSAATNEARVIRADLRQADGMAAVWVTVFLNLSFPRRPGEVGEGERVEHLVLHRTGNGWRIVLLTLPGIPR